jgi:hypothetical protein
MHELSTAGVIRTSWYVTRAASRTGRDGIASVRAVCYSWHRASSTASRISGSTRPSGSSSTGGTAASRRGRSHELLDPGGAKPEDCTEWLRMRRALWDDGPRRGAGPGDRGKHRQRFGGDLRRPMARRVVRISWRRPSAPGLSDRDDAGRLDRRLVRRSRHAATRRGHGRKATGQRLPTPSYGTRSATGPTGRRALKKRSGSSSSRRTWE